MAFRAKQKISIGGYDATKFVSSVTTSETWREITQTCTLTLANLQQMLDNAFVVGDPVTVQLSMSPNNDDNFKTEFTGYISAISGKIPYTLICENEAWKLKRAARITKTYSGSLHGLIQEVAPNAIVADNLPSLTLTNFVMQNVTAFQVLKSLRERYNLVAYYRDSTLYVGLPYLESNLPTVLYDFQNNIIRNKLEFVSEDSQKVAVRAVSYLDNGETIETEVGDSDGAKRTLNFYNITSESELRKVATSKLQDLKFAGYKGDFLAFGLPEVRQGWSVRLRDTRYPQREGVYIADEVETNFDERGFRRKIKLGIKL